MRTLSFVLAAVLMFSVEASADTILTYTGQDYTTASTVCDTLNVQSPTLQAFCDSKSATQPQYTTTDNLSIQIDLADTVTLPQNGDFEEFPLTGSPDVVSETISDGVNVISSFTSNETNAIDLTFANGNIVGWLFNFAIPGPNQYPLRLKSCFGASCDTVGDSVQQISSIQYFCGDLFPNAGGDCPAYWTNSASTASVGSWSIINTDATGNVIASAPEPRSFALLIIGLPAALYLRRRSQKRPDSLNQAVVTLPSVQIPT